MTDMATASGFLRAQDEPGVLVRICATITGRGYIVRTLSVEIGDQGEVVVSFTVAARPEWLERLPLFLNRIVSVHDVVMASAPSLDKPKEALG